MRFLAPIPINRQRLRSAPRQPSFFVSLLSATILRRVGLINPQNRGPNSTLDNAFRLDRRHSSPPTPPEELTIKRKRERADSAQLKVLDETYSRTIFPSMEERTALANMLDMSPRSIQIW